MAKIIFDTDIIIDALRYYEPAREFIRNNIDNSVISVLTYVEVMRGNRNRGDEKSATGLMRRLKKIEVSENIAELAGSFAAKYWRSHRTGSIDSIIAATAQIHHLQLATLNKKHFPMLAKLIVPYKKS